MTSPETCPQDPWAAFRHALRRLRRRRAAVAALFALLAAGVVAGAYLKRPVYESSALLLIQLDRRIISSTPSDVRYQTAHILAEEAILTQAEILRSHDLARRVLERVGPEALEGGGRPGRLVRWLQAVAEPVREAAVRALVRARLIPEPDPWQEALERLRRGLRVYPVRRSQIIEVSFRARSPEAARQVLDAFVDLYLQKQAAIDAYSQSYNYYKEQAERQLERLRQAERALAEYKAEHEIVDLDKERSLLLKEIEQLSRILRAGGLARPAPAPAPPARPQALPTSEEIAQLKRQLDQLQVERAKLLSRQLPGSPDVQEISRQIEEVEKILEAKLEAVAGALAGYQARLKALNLAEPRLNQLVRQVKLAEDTYDIYRKAMEDRRLALEQEARVTVQVVDPPTSPAAPRPPTRLKLILWGLALAALLAVAAGALLPERRRPREGPPPAPASGG